MLLYMCTFFVHTLAQVCSLVLHGCTGWRHKTVTSLSKLSAEREDGNTMELQVTACNCFVIPGVL